MTHIIFAHSYFDRSKANKTLLDSLKNEQDITCSKLHERYADGKIDIAREHEDLSKADKIVWQFPLFWYSAPAILKSWQDEVLTPLYTQTNTVISGKKVGMIVTLGGSKNDYKPYDSANESAMQRILLPLFLTIKAVNALPQEPLLFYSAEKLENIDTKIYLNYLKNL